MTPAQRKRFESCLALAERGATAGEREAGLAAAKRVASAAGLTVAEAKVRVRRIGAGAAEVPPRWSGPYPTGPYRRATRRPKPKKPPGPTTVAEALRQKAKGDAERRRKADAADRRLLKELAEQAAYEAQQRELQAERDREWAASRGERTFTP